MRGQAGFFDVDERLKELSAKGDTLERLNGIVDFGAVPVRLVAVGTPPGWCEGRTPAVRPRVHVQGAGASPATTGSPRTISPPSASPPRSATGYESGP